MDQKTYPADNKLPLHTTPQPQPQQPTQIWILTSNSKRNYWFGLALLSFSLFCFHMMMATHMRGATAFYPGPHCQAGYNPIDMTGMFTFHREKVRNSLSGSGDVILMIGNKQEERSNSDTDILFRQDSSFLYLTGYNVPDCYLAVDVDSGYSVLFLRRKSRSELIFDGGYDDVEAIAKMTEVDDVRYDDELEDVLAEDFQVQRLLTVDADLLLSEFPSLDIYDINQSILLPVIFQARWAKSRWEIEMLKFSSEVSALAHISMMKSVAPGQFESDLESLFLYETYNCDHRFQAYISIVGTGKNGAVLHYIANNAEIKNGDIILIDAAGEYKGYTSDITRTFPANGVYTSDQVDVYEIVLAAQEAAIVLMKPGASWSSMQNAANRALAQGMLDRGFLLGNVDTILSTGVLGKFYPHGLGHPVGLDVHDPYPTGNFQSGYVYTVEPGIYFVDMLLEEAANDPIINPQINWEKVDRFRDFGGVRIEDVILVTDDGYEIISDAVPKQIIEIEKLMAGL